MEEEKAITFIGEAEQNAHQPYLPKSTALAFNRKPYLFLFKGAKKFMSLIWSLEYHRSLPSKTAAVKDICQYPNDFTMLCLHTRVQFFLFESDVVVIFVDFSLGTFYFLHSEYIQCNRFKTCRSRCCCYYRTIYISVRNHLSELRRTRSIYMHWLE